MGHSYNVSKQLPADASVFVQEAEALVAAMLPADRCAAAPEIAVYLKEAVGNATRIDYGTGNCAAYCTIILDRALMLPSNKS